MEIARALTIAGSDSGGGAGIQADLKTFSVLNVYGASVITALTAQNTCGVEAVQEVPPDFVTKQINAVCQDIKIDSIKTGMLANKEIIGAVAEGISKFSLHPFVLDPVMVAQSGDKLLQDDAVDAIKNQLLPLADIITPNLPEAAVLLQTSEKDVQDNPWSAARELLRLMEPRGNKLGNKWGKQGGNESAKSAGGKTTQAVLLKGGHAVSDEGGTTKGEVIKDYFLMQGGKKILDKPKIQTVNTHGTGCTLSAAISAYLARKYPMEKAVELADQYLHGAIKSAVNIMLGGKGLSQPGHTEKSPQEHREEQKEEDREEYRQEQRQSCGPVNHLYTLNPNADD